MAHHVLTLRQLVVENGPASPFQQVLSWLSNREDYFTAASVALDLLHDAETLFHLWKNAEKFDEDDEQTKLEGLLDGIVPIVRRETNDTEDDPQSSHSNTMTQLADMTVACLTKGGFAMSETLQKFLNRNSHYDPARACLMLVATTASAISDDPESVASVMGRSNGSSSDPEDLLWPVRCLLEIGVTRDSLSTALVLLNVTIPDELRRRARQGYTSSVFLPAKELSKKLVTLIVASSPDAADLLLGLVDDLSRSRFWQSLEHETQLVLSLIDIESKCPLLRHPEVRAWARQELHTCLKNEGSASANVFEIMPTQWLQQLCVACLHNAGCDLGDFVIEPSMPSSATSETESSEGDESESLPSFEDGLDKHIPHISTRTKKHTGKLVVMAGGAPGATSQAWITTPLPATTTLAAPSMPSTRTAPAFLTSLIRLAISTMTAVREPWRNQWS
jgi:hypothetical protein